MSIPLILTKTIKKNNCQVLREAIYLLVFKKTLTLK
jgi:hypothetical protein